MSWSDRYLGIPFCDLGRDISGCDCWGLVHLVYASELQIDLPSYRHAYNSTDERAEIEGLIGTAAASSVWHAQSDPEAYDVILFRRGQLTAHIGIIVRPYWMLHMAETGARVECYGMPSWQQRLRGIYRHERLMA